MAFSDRVMSLTQDSFAPAVIDQALNGNVITCRTLARSSRRWNGESMKFPIAVTANTNGGSFDGTDLFDTSAQDPFRKLSFDPKWYDQPVTIVGTERVVNTGEAQQISLVRASMEWARQSMLNSLGTLFYGLGTGKDFQGLGAIVDDGTDQGTYGGLSRTTYTALNATRTAASGGALTLDNMGTSYDAASASSSDQESPNLIVTTKTVWSLYEGLLTPTTRSNYNSEGYPRINAYTASGVSERGEGLKGRGGFRALDFRGVPVVSDDKATSGNIFFLNEKYLNFYAVKDNELQSYKRSGDTIEGVYSEPGKMTGEYPIQWRAFVTPANQYAEIGVFIMGGNFVGDAPRRSSRLTGVTTS